MGEGRECVYVGVCMSVCGCVYILESVDEGLSKRMTTANRIALSFPVQSHNSACGDLKGMVWNILSGECLNYADLEKHPPMLETAVLYSTHWYRLISFQNEPMTLSLTQRIVGLGQPKMRQAPNQTSTLFVDI